MTFTGVSFFKATPLVMTVSPAFNPDKINREASVLVAVSTMTSFAFPKSEIKTFFRFEQESLPALESQ
jgi:hypothetical protein